MSKPKSILKKPSSSVPKASTSQSSESAPRVGALQKGKATASGSKLSQSFSVKSSRPTSKHQENDRDDSDNDSLEDEHEADDNDFGEEEELDTDEEISRSKGETRGKAVKTKRKAPTTAETFGSTLSALLSEPGPSKRIKTERPTIEDASALKKSKAASKSEKKPQTKPSSINPILSLSHAKLPPSKASVSLERRAARKVKQDKEEKEDRARVRDVVEGWTAADGTGGMEFEKGLRKVAQKGVIKLFNAILVASKSSEGADTTLSAKAGLKEEKGGRKEKDNVLGRGGKAAEGKGLTSESFLDLVRKG